jgi:GNAT superfamily N-acetyltransferase
MSELTVRRARGADVEVMAELATQLGYDIAPAHIGRWLAAGAEGRVAFVAAFGGDVVGWAQAHNMELLQYPRVLEVGGLVVADRVRGRGAGKLLIDAIADWGRRHGHTEIQVRSNVTRADAHEFYEALGFESVKTSHTFSKAI